MTEPLDKYNVVVWAGGGQAVTTVLVGTEWGSCSEVCDPVTGFGENAHNVSDIFPMT